MFFLFHLIVFLMVAGRMVISLSLLMFFSVRLVLLSNLF